LLKLEGSVALDRSSTSLVQSQHLLPHAS